MHKTYCELSGMDVLLRFDRTSAWMQFMRENFTKNDLVAVLERLRILVKKGDRRPECLKFSNVVEQLDRFEEELAMVKAETAGITPVERMSVMELSRVIEAKQIRQKILAREHAIEDVFGLKWDTEESKAQYFKLCKEIRKCQERLSKMA